MCVLSCFSHVWLFATLWTVAHQAPLSMGVSGKNTGVGCHALFQIFRAPRSLEPESLRWPALAGGFFTTSATWVFKSPLHISIFLSIDCRTLVPPCSFDCTSLINSEAEYFPLFYWNLCIFLCKLPICVHACFSIRVFTFVLIDLKGLDLTPWLLQRFRNVCLRNPGI